jgi:GntR family transcriptional regulator
MAIERESVYMPTKYERIANDLRERITSGEYRPGSRLPTRERLSEQYNASPGPVDEALAVLRGEGLIDTHHGLGTFVRTPRHKVQRTPDRYQWEKDRVGLPNDERLRSGAFQRDTGLESEDFECYAEYEAEEADHQLAEAFRIPTGTKLLRRSYRVRATGEDAPVSLITSYVVYDMIMTNPALLDSANEPWPGGTMHQLATVGIEVSAITDRIGARPPTTVETDQLGIGPGVAVLVLRKTSSDVSGRVVEVSDVILPGDRTEFVYTTALRGWRSK